MLVSAQIYNTLGNYFQMKGADGKYIPAKLNSNGYLVPGTVNDHPSQDDILTVYKTRIRHF